MIHEKKLDAQIDRYIDQIFKPHIRQRGRNYFRGNCVCVAEYDSEEMIVFFLVTGSEFYETEVQFNQDGGLSHVVSTHCSCPAADFDACKHQAACLYWIKANMAELQILVSDHNEVPGTETPTFKPKKKEAWKKTLRLTSEPIRIENFEQHKDFRQKYAMPHFNYPYSTIMRIDEIKPGYFAVELLQSFYQNFERGLHSLITLQIDKKDLNVTCDCDQRVQQLCPHSALIIDTLQQQNLLSQLKQPSAQQLKLQGQQALNEYGLNPKAKWQLYFEFRMTTEGRKMVLKPEYAKLMKKDKFQELTKRYQLNNSSEEILVEIESSIVDEKTRSQTHQVGFAFYFGPPHKSRFGMHTVYALPDKNGKPMAKGFRCVSNLRRSDKVNYRKEDRLLEQFVNQNFEIKEATAHSALSVSRLLNDMSETLAAHPHLFITHSPIFRSVRKSEIEPIDFEVGFPPIRYELHQKDDLLELRVCITHKEKAFRPEMPEVAMPYPHFLLINNTLFYSASPEEAAHLKMAFELDGSLMTRVRFSESFSQHLAPIFRKYPLEIMGDTSIEVLTQKQKVVAKELYLSEVGDFVIFKPFLRYEDDTLVELLNDGTIWDTEGESLRTKSHDNEEAQKFHDAIRESHPKFKQQFRSDFFHLSYKDLLDEHKFVELFQALNNAEVKVFGEKNLSKLKSIPVPAQVSYTVQRDIDWFELNATFTFGDQNVSLSQLKKRFIPGSRFIDLGDGKRGSLPEEWYRRLQRIFQMGKSKGEGMQVPTFHFNIIDELFNDLKDPGINEFIAERRGKLIHFETPQAQPLPKGIKAKLRPYQQEGYQWLCFLKSFGWGGILADDMGLGKTLQIITFLKYVLQENKQCNLVVVPTSLLFNWENELKKFAPGIKYHFHYGATRSRDMKTFNKAGLVITSYGHLVSDADLLSTFEFNYVVLDESQAIKNTASKRYKAARLLKAQNRIAMTGTPVENHTFDLFAQLSFVNPGMLGSAAQFKSQYAKAIDNLQDAERAAELQKMVKPFILRRTKEQVAQELPEKVEDIIYCDMDKSQRKVYDAHRNDIRKSLLGEEESEIITTERFKVLQALTKLRQICNSPMLLPGNEKYSGASVKIDTLMTHIGEKTGDHKILIFSQFTQMLALIRKELEQEEINYAYLDGQCNTKQRQEAVNRFQSDSDCRVFLISLKAGGTGLNLMAADYVYIVDPWWNPAVENQAIDRCYRIGQDKKVIAYRMICRHTVEEKIQELQSRKKQLAQDLISTDEGVIQKLDGRELKELFL
ncbi:MAG: hypothetical protein EA392_11765 [Cryomorphaceae bacterium]|nr:MAG: hypothetical protein EA392_11765 [Cryomorphaceae bacterium]